MRTEYENMVKEFLPALRAGAAKKLVGEYGVSQMEAARMLQTTQAAVSKYLNGRYSAKVKALESSFREGEVEEFVKDLMAGDEYDAQKIVCRMCSRGLSFECGLKVR